MLHVGGEPIARLRVGSNLESFSALIISTAVLALGQDRILNIRHGVCAAFSYREPEKLHNGIESLHSGLILGLFGGGAYNHKPLLSCSRIPSVSVRSLLFSSSGEELHLMGHATQ